MVYRRRADRFEDLDGPGMALGIDGEFRYATRERADLEGGDIVLIGTDGIWEAADARGVMFGKQAFRALVRRHRDAPAASIIAAVFDAVGQHIGGAQPADDMTLVVVKLEQEERAGGR
jgi:sigma-B regulation protein RsbU (phosphoserine phosphatase)